MKNTVASERLAFTKRLYLLAATAKEMSGQAAQSQEVMSFFRGGLRYDRVLVL